MIVNQVLGVQISILAKRSSICQKPYAAVGPDKNGSNNIDVITDIYNHIYIYIHHVSLMIEKIEPRLNDFPENQWMMSEIP